MLLYESAVFLLIGAIFLSHANIIDGSIEKSNDDNDDSSIFDIINNNNNDDENNNDEKSKTHVPRPYYYVSHDTYDRPLCTSERCNDAADLFLRSVKKSSRPCDDFFTFACGKKGKKVLLPVKEIREILEQPSIEDNQVRALAFEKKFYRSCMEQADSDRKTKREFTKILELSRGIDLFRDDGTFDGKNWQFKDTFYASLGFENALFSVKVTRDPENSDVNVVTLGPPSSLYFYSVHGMLKYKNFTEIVSNLVGNYEILNPYIVDYDDVMEFNKALHEILPPLGMLEDNVTTLIRNKMTIDEWQTTYDESFPQIVDGLFDDDDNHIVWSKVLNALFGTTAKLRLDSANEIVIKKLDYFVKLKRLLSKTSSITLEKFVHFKFIAQISKYLNPRLARFFENVRDRSAFCVKQFENQLVGVTYEYIKRHVPSEQKIYANKIMNDVRSALIDLLLNAKWMDDETKSYAMNKLRNLQMIVGYPEWQADKNIVDNYYRRLSLDSHFFGNVIKFKKRSLTNELRGLKYPQFYDPQTMSKQSVPLIYHFEVNSHMNRIFFPADYLNEKKYKLFSPKLPSAINYGSFGSMLGSILYDYVSLTDNLKYNQFYTRTNDGLSKETIEAYKLKEKCLTNQLSHYKKSSSKFHQSLASVINRDTIQVDKIYEKMTGLRAAFEAYKRVQKTDEELLPGFEDINQNQLFFLAYAERICEIGDIYDVYDAYETSLKVNGVVSNLEDFSDTFQCDRYSDMNRETKCELFT